MAESKSEPCRSRSSSPTATFTSTGKSLWSFSLLLAAAAPVLLAALLYHLDSFNPAPLPAPAWTREPIFVPKRNARMLQGIEPIGSGRLLGPEDIAYDRSSNLIYTGCLDGWLKRVKLNDSAADSVENVEDWVNTGGRPLGLAFDVDKHLIVADADKGLLKITENGKIELLTDEAEGVPFKLTDAVDVASDGMIYFTDASYKYRLKDFVWDFVEGKPHGRLLSYNPSTKQTKVLLKDLYFANGITLSPSQDYVIFCETAMRWCKKYYIRGERKGSVDMFISNLPGVPDNIHYDGEGRYWIALSADTYAWDIVLRYPFIRKLVGIMVKHIGRPNMERNSGVVAVDMDGKLIAHYYDPKLSLISSGIKIGDHLYCGSLHYPHIIRLNLDRHPALAVGA